MPDRIAGNFSYMLSRDTLKLIITQTASENKNYYDLKHIVRVTNFPSELDELSDDAAKYSLEEGLTGKELICDIQSTEADGTLVCEVFIRD